MKKIALAFATAVSVMASGLAGAAEPGVTDNEIRIGTVTDLSGPLAVWGVPWTNGARIRIDEINAAGGINGRKLKLFVEDAKYQVPLTIRSTNLLLNKEKIFGMIGSMGTSQNLAARPMIEKKGRLNLFPLTGAATMYEPQHPYRFSYFLSYAKQARGALMHFAKQGIKKVCLQTLATDYGQEIDGAFQESAKELGLTVTGVGFHKTTETEFSGTATKIKNSDCEALVMGTTVKDTIVLYTTLRKLGWDKPIVANMVAYMPLVAAAAGGAMEGMYLVAPIYLPEHTEVTNDTAKVFLNKYKEQYGKDAAVQAIIGYNSIEIFAQAVEKSGDNITTDTVAKALESIGTYEDPFGGASLTFNEKKHHGSDSMLLYQVQGSKFVPVVKGLPY